ncbi:MAG TPA: carboxymuconolactone decarboxylase family protein [Rhodopila sp.]|nr:carboxymuconolactone decarboxylase family protein [Rhodopila sp.]
MSRQDLRHQGEAMLKTLFGSAAQPAGLANLLTEAAYGGIWTRPGLSLPDRLLCSIAALATVPRLTTLRRLLTAGLEHELSAEAIREILVQASLYAGFSAAEETLALAGEVFAQHNIQFPADPPENASLAELDDRGRGLMHRLHGSRATQGYAAPDNPVTGALYPLAIRFGYGEIWFRPGLAHRQRALVAVAAFTALRLPEQVAKFGQSALNIGLSPTEVIEAIIQTAPYTGFPPALNALGAISGAFATNAGRETGGEEDTGRAPTGNTQGHR